MLEYDENEILTLEIVEVKCRNEPEDMEQDFRELLRELKEEEKVLKTWRVYK